MGQKVILPQQRAMHPGHPGQAMGATPGMPGMVGMGGGMQHQAAMLAAQNREMEALERRQARERATAMPAHAVRNLNLSLCYTLFTLPDEFVHFRLTCSSPSWISNKRRHSTMMILEVR